LVVVEVELLVLVVVDVLLVVVLVLLVLLMLDVVVLVLDVVEEVVVVVDVVLVEVDTDVPALARGSVAGAAELVSTLHPAATRRSVMTGSVTRLVR
jgi:hypothetical protein